MTMTRKISLENKSHLRDPYYFTTTHLAYFYSLEDVHYNLPDVKNAPEISKDYWKITCRMLKWFGIFLTALRGEFSRKQTTS